MLWTKSFWKGAAERALKTFFQTLVALIGTSTIIAEVDWQFVLSGSVLATLLSVATSIGNADFTAVPDVEYPAEKNPVLIEE